MKRLAMALGSVMFLILGSMSTVTAAAPQTGKPAPDFTAVDILGQKHKLSDYRGKVVVLEAYNYSCPFVVYHYNSGAMQELQAKYAEQGVVWLLVNSTHPEHANYRTTEAAKQEWDRLKIKAHAWLHDRDGKVGQLYAMRTTPHMFVINAEGILVYQGAIDDQARTSGDPRESRNYVKAALDQVLAGQRVEVAESRPYGCSVKYTPQS